MRTQITTVPIGGSR